MNNRQKATKKQRQRLECLQMTVESELKGLGKYINDPRYEFSKTYLENLKTNLENMQKSLNRYIGFLDGERNLTIGVFGCPSRGKSTLLNVLLGVEILPVEAKPGTTRFGTYLSYTNSEGEKEPFKVTIYYNNKSPLLRSYKDEVDVKYQLGFISKEADNKDPDIIRINVEGPFKSFLGDDIVFLDTPGVELGASKKDLSEDGIIAEHDFEADTERALEILSIVDIVIYCMTLKYSERKDKVFYIEKIKDKFEPINVITAAETGRNEGLTNDKIKLELMKDYELVLGQTVAVSSKESLEIVKKVKKRKITKYKFKGENLEGFNQLKMEINARIGKKDHAFCEKKIQQFKDRYDSIKQDADNKGLGFVLRDVILKIPKPPSKIKGLFSALGKALSKFFIGIAKALKIILIVVGYIIVAAIVIVVLYLIFGNR